MKIEAFDYIKKATKELNGLRSRLEEAALKLTGYFEQILGEKDEAVSFIYRIKTGDSLREKILRNELYKKVEADSLFDTLSDIIGIRIGCRFLKDEKFIYERLKNHFFMENGEGHLYHPGNKDICLKLSAAQPERQQNGFDIYRIDGYILHNGVKFRFELQIKSLINNFWSDIEHRIIYKNKRYLGGDSFIGELMNLIYANLVNIDTQLNMLFARSEDRSNTEFFEQTEKIITVMMDELSSELVEYKTGIAVNMNEFSVSLVKYILSDSSFKAEAENGEKYSSVVINLIRRLQSMEFMQIPVGEQIEFEMPQWSNGLEKAAGEKLYGEINTDFFVNTFFHILFAVEKGGDTQKFLRFVLFCCQYLKKENADKPDSEIIRRINPEPANRLLKLS